MTKIATRYIPTSFVCRPPRYSNSIRAGIDLYDFLARDKGQLPSPGDTLACSDAAVLTQSYPRAHTAAAATTANTDNAEQPEEPMLTKDIAHLTPIPAADCSMLREILHPERDPVDIRYSLAHAVVHGGGASLRHRLASVEVYHFLAGTGVMHVDEESATVGPGRTVVVPAGATQWVCNTGNHDLEFLCIVDPAWREEDEEFSW